MCDGKNERNIDVNEGDFSFCRLSWHIEVTSEQEGRKFDSHRPCMELHVLPLSCFVRLKSQS